MKHSRLLTLIALIPFGCGQGNQNAPAQSQGAVASTPASAAPAATSPAPVAEATAAPPERSAPAPEKAAPVAQKPASTVEKAAAPKAAPAPQPVATAAAAPAEKAPAPRLRMIIPAGTTLPVEIQSTLSTDSSKEGDAVLATLTEDVKLDGFTLDKGAEVRGRVYTAVAAKRVKGRARLVFGFEEVMKKGEKLAISTDAIDTTAASTSGKDKKVIAGGAVGGLILGAIKDGKKGAAIGTVIGAAAGTGAVLIMKGDEVEIPRGARLTVTVTK